MAFFFLCITVFIMFFQPVAVFPDMAWQQPLRDSALLAVFFYLSSKDKSKVKFFSVKTNVYFVLFALMQIISSSKIWLHAGIETFNLWLKLGIVYYLIFKSVTSENKLRWIIIMIISAVGYLSYYSLSSFVVNYIPGTRARGFGWYENSNDLSIILVSVIPLTILIANTTKNKFLKYLFFLIAGVFSFNILFTSSRNGLLGLCCVGTLSLMNSTHIVRPLRVILLLVLLFAVVGVGLTNVLSRSDLSALTGDDSSENRKVQWKAGVRMTLDNPLFGVGPGEFKYRTTDYQGIRGLEPHNTVVQVFAETGIIGGVFFVLFAVFPLTEGRKYFKKLKLQIVSEEVIIYKFLLISLTGFWVCAFFSNRYLTYILYVLVALILSTRRIIEEKAVVCK